MFLSRLQESAFQSKEINELHNIIDQQSLPIKKTADFFEQCNYIEAYLGQSNFSTYAARVKKMNIVSGICAAPTLLLVVAAVISSKTFDERDWILDYWMIWSLILAVSIIATVIQTIRYHRGQHRLYTTQYASFKQTLINHSGLSKNAE